jgi:hypothetical protein
MQIFTQKKQEKVINSIPSPAYRSLIIVLINIASSKNIFLLYMLNTISSCKCILFFSYDGLFFVTFLKIILI